MKTVFIVISMYSHVLADLYLCSKTKTIKVQTLGVCAMC